MDGKIVSFGVIGCNMGLQHMRGLRTLNGGKLGAICDINEDIMNKASKEMGLDGSNCYRDYRDMIKRDDIDAVIIASPDQIHLDQTIAALEAGKHVLCEKPMAMTVEECIKMINASERTSRKLMIGQISRYTPGFISARKLIKNCEIGELFFVEAEYAHDYSGIPGVGNWRLDSKRLRHPALGGGCHAVDLLRWIAGDPYEVCAFANKKVLTDWPVDDCTIGIMRFPDNVIGKVLVSVGCKRDYTMRSVFYGTKGTIIADNTSNFITVFKESANGGAQLFEGVDNKVVGLKYPVNIRNHNTAGEIMEFIDIILNDRPVVTDGRQGASTVAACLAMVESAGRNGENIKITYNF